MSVRVILYILGVVVCFVSAQVDENNAAPKPTPMAIVANCECVIDECDDANYFENKTRCLVIKDEQTLNQVWKNYIGPKPIPKLEENFFENNLAVLILYGACKTNGYSLKITEVKRDVIKTYIVGEITEPDSLNDKHVIVKFTCPYALIQISRKNINLKNHYFFLWLKKTTYPVYLIEIPK